MRVRHRDWFLEQAERSPFLLLDPQHIAWLSQELDNLRAALRCSILVPARRSGTAPGKGSGAFWYQRGFTRRYVPTRHRVR
jgi:hypothetical protein